MSLVTQHKLPLHVIKVCVLFDAFLLLFVVFFTSFLGWLHLRQQVFMASEQLEGVNLADLAEGDVRVFLFEAAVDVNEVARGPT